MAVVVSDTFDFNSTSYYYHYNSGTGVSSEANFLASSYAPYAVYWAYSANAVYGKDAASVIINLAPKTYTISSGKLLYVCAGCAPLLSVTDATDNIVLAANVSSRFGAVSEAVILPASGTVDLDITSVVDFASKNYNCPWGLYLIGVGNANYASKVTIADPTFTEKLLTSGVTNVKTDSAWEHGVPYIRQVEGWVQSSKLYVNDGNNWVQVNRRL